MLAVAELRWDIPSVQVARAFWSHWFTTSFEPMAAEEFAACAWAVETQ
jgi:hypothetical protein